MTPFNLALSHSLRLLPLKVLVHLLYLSNCLGDHPSVVPFLKIAGSE